MLNPKLLSQRIRYSILSIALVSGLAAFSDGGDPINKPFDHSLKKGVINKNNFATIPTYKLSNFDVSYIDPKLLVRMGLAKPGESLESLKAKFASRFGWEVVRPENLKEFGYDINGPIPGVKGKPSYTEPVTALAYDDGYMGIGDGRASWLLEVPIPGKGTYDIGSKGTGITRYGIPQASIDAGYHVAEKDGYLGLSEAVLVLQDAQMLEALGIEAEKTLGIIETNKKTGYNLKPQKIEPTAIVIRAFEGGLRGAHLRKYSPDEIKRVGEWLRQREAVRLGTKETPTLEQYVQNKIVRDAKRAATAQHFWVIHGAINVANITEGAWADLAYVEAMRIPDKNYTSLNIYSGLGLQSKEFLKVTSEFASRITFGKQTAKATADLYWKAYAKELSRLELISAGIRPATADKIVEKDFELALEYKNSIWEANYDYLNTDTKELKKILALALDPKTEFNATTTDDFYEVMKAVSRGGGIVPEKLLHHERVGKWERRYHITKQYLAEKFGLVKNRAGSLPIDKIENLFFLTNELAAEAAAIEGRPYGEVVSEMFANARMIGNIKLPTRAELVESYEKYEKSNTRDLNSFLGERAKEFRSLKKMLDYSYGRKTEKSNVRSLVEKRGLETEKELQKRKDNEKKTEDFVKRLRQTGQRRRAI